MTCSERFLEFMWGDMHLWDYFENQSDYAPYYVYVEGYVDGLEFSPPDDIVIDDVQIEFKGVAFIGDIKIDATEMLSAAGRTSLESDLVCEGHTF